MDEFLGFIDLVGLTIDGRPIYRFDFTYDTETIWGDYFNITPSAIIPDLQPDKNAISKQAKAIFPREMVIAKKNYCFSMQDCIDGIIPLIFSEIDDETLEYDNKPFFLRFGENLETVVEKLKLVNIEFYEIEEMKNGDESAIDALIENMDDSLIEDEDDDDYDENF
jgi:hypothetical protein